MKKNLLLICTLLVVLFSACRKDHSTEDFAAQQAIVDEGIIKTYMQTNQIVGTRDASGLYYAVLSPGTGAFPTANSTVNVNYKGTFTDGTVFDAGNFTTVVSGNVIEGWKIGLPKINQGGRILLMVPSALAYGPQGRSTIPANKVLIFQIDMLNIR